jgi:hypothetical protein
MLELILYWLDRGLTRWAASLIPEFPERESVEKPASNDAHDMTLIMNNMERTLPPAFKGGSSTYDKLIERSMVMTARLPVKNKDCPPGDYTHGIQYAVRCQHRGFLLWVNAWIRPDRLIEVSVSAHSCFGLRFFPLEWYVTRRANDVVGAPTAGIGQHGYHFDADYDARGVYLETLPHWTEELMGGTKKTIEGICDGPELKCEFKREICRWILQFPEAKWRPYINNGNTWRQDGTDNHPPIPGCLDRIVEKMERDLAERTAWYRWNMVIGRRPCV